MSLPLPSDLIWYFPPLSIFFLFSSSSLIVARTRLSTVGDRTYPVVAASIWSSLPQHVTSALSTLLSSGHVLTRFLLLARYVPNVAKRSIWEQCKKKYILRTDRRPTGRPTDQPHIWENFKWPYLREGSSDPLHVWFRWLQWGFRGRRIEWS